jgi:hypothetical protein
MGIDCTVETSVRCFSRDCGSETVTWEKQWLHREVLKCVKKKRVIITQLSTYAHKNNKQVKVLVIPACKSLFFKRTL